MDRQTEGRTGGAAVIEKGRAFQSQETARAKGRKAGQFAITNISSGAVFL